MTFEQYNLLICMIVYVALVLVSIAVIAKLMSLAIKVIRNGGDDEYIIKEDEKRRFDEGKVRKIAGKVADWLFSLILFIAFACVFVFSIHMDYSNKYATDVPTLKVVQSASMSKKNKINNYLFDNALDDQVQVFDIVLLYGVEDVNDLQLYDIIVYEYDGQDILHRIVQIIEPNEEHPNERWFKTRGDALAADDYFYIQSDDIKAVYKGERVKNVGSVVVFLQSPAGWMCLILMAVATLVTPLLDKQLDKERQERLQVILLTEQFERRDEILKQQAIARTVAGYANGGSPTQYAQGASPCNARTPAPQYYQQAQTEQQRQQMLAAQQRQQMLAAQQRQQMQAAQQRQQMLAAQQRQQAQAEALQREKLKRMQAMRAAQEEEEDEDDIMSIPQYQTIKRVEDGVVVCYIPIPGTDPVRYVRKEMKGQSPARLVKRPDKNGNGGLR